MIQTHDEPQRVNDSIDGFYGLKSIGDGANLLLIRIFVGALTGVLLLADLLGY